MKWSGQHNTEGEEEPESNIPGIAARPAPEGETCFSIDESTFLLNKVVSMNDNKLVATLQNQSENEYISVITAACSFNFVSLSEITRLS